MEETGASCTIRVQKVIFMRHAVAKHNIPGSDIHSPNLFDPSLILQGKVGAVEAGDRIQSWWQANYSGKGIDLIVASPLTRCIQTATLAFLPGEEYFESNHKRFVCSEKVREAYGVHYPDKRRQKSLLQNHWKGVCFDSDMTEEDELWKPTVRESRVDLMDRVADFINELVLRAETAIIVVSHGVWIESCLTMYFPTFLGDRRVYNCEAFVCDCLSQNGKFVRLDNIQQI